MLPQVEKLAAMLGKPKSRAFYRVNAVRSTTGGHTVGQGMVAGGNAHVRYRHAIFQFRQPLVMIPPGTRWVDVYIDRTGNTEIPCSVMYRSVGSAHGSETRSEGVVEFAKGQVDSYLRMSVLNAESAFYCVLVDPSPGGECGHNWHAAILVEQGNSPGMLRFERERYTVKESQGVMLVKIKRVGGLSGKITFRLKTKDQTAIGGSDYVPIDQEVGLAACPAALGAHPLHQESSSTVALHSTISARLSSRSMASWEHPVQGPVPEPHMHDD